MNSCDSQILQTKKNLQPLELCADGSFFNVNL